jgi:anti-anti-sigma factor
MGPQPALPGSITVQDEAGRRVLCLTGDVDSAVVAWFQSSQGSTPVVVDGIDAGAVTFMSSTGLALMLRAVEASTAAGRSAVLRSSSHVVDRLLRIAGMEHAFPRPHGTSDAGGPLPQ